MQRAKSASTIFIHSPVMSFASERPHAERSLVKNFRLSSDLQILNSGVPSIDTTGSDFLKQADC